MDNTENPFQKRGSVVGTCIFIALMIIILAVYSYVIGVLKDVLEERSKARQEEMIRERDLLYNGFSSWNEYSHYRRLHKFHGTLYSERDETGTDVFYRDGKRCLLWDPLVRTDR